LINNKYKIKFYLLKIFLFSISFALSWHLFVAYFWHYENYKVDITYLSLVPIIIIFMSIYSISAIINNKLTNDIESYQIKPTIISIIIDSLLSISYCLVITFLYFILSKTSIIIDFRFSSSLLYEYLQFILIITFINLMIAIIFFVFYWSMVIKKLYFLIDLCIVNAKIISIVCLGYSIGYNFIQIY
jgi:hypothetical protein